MHGFCLVSSVYYNHYGTSVWNFLSVCAVTFRYSRPKSSHGPPGFRASGVCTLEPREPNSIYPPQGHTLGPECIPTPFDRISCFLAAFVFLSALVYAGAVSAILVRGSTPQHTPYPAKGPVLPRGPG